MIEQQKIEISTEEKIICFMIMNEDVCRSAYERYTAKELKTNYFNKFNRRIFFWIIIYYSKTNRPPKNNIQEIYKRKKKSLGNETKELIETTLENLADNYVEFEENAISPEDVILFDIPNFIKANQIEKRIEKIQQHVENGEIEEASNLMSNYIEIDDAEAEKEDMGIIMPMTKEDALKSRCETSGSEIVYEFDGDLGNLIGPLRKSWLVAITGTEKSGKSFLMDDIAYDAVFYQDKKVLKINLELSEEIQRLRLRKRISHTCDEDQSGYIVYPVLDCENNQFGTCRIPHMQKKIKRKKSTSLFETPSEIICYQNNSSWSVCTECHNNPRIRANARDTKKFIPTIWFDQSKVKPLNDNRFYRSLKEFREKTLNNFRVKCFPRFSKTFEEIRSYIFRYIDKTKWVPDIVLIDYLDITAQVEKDIRIDTDRKWKQASQLAGELNALVFNADQAIKSSRTAYQMDQLSTSESKTKDAHLDIRIALNKTDLESALGIARIGVLFHRHRKFSVANEVLITQRLETSQSFIENSRIWVREKKYMVIPYPV